jgi:hypothetical protein
MSSRTRVVRTCQYLTELSIAMSYGLDRQGSIPGRGRRFFSTPQHSDQLWPTQPPIQWVPGALSPGESAEI